ncbi:ZIP family metal transporter [soil metagenome]
MRSNHGFIASNPFRAPKDESLWRPTMMLGALAGVTAVQIGAVFAAWGLRSRERFLRRYLPMFVSLAVGVLLATALLHLLPEAVGQLGNRQGVWLLLGGTMLALFASERIVSLVTGAHPEPEPLEDFDAGHVHSHSTHATRPINLVIASMLHSFVDGAAVATAFAAGEKIGWLTTFAIALHEIPHRMGDFALLVHLNVPLKRALRLAFLAGMPSLLGVLAVYAIGVTHADRILWFLPVSAGSFLYIATVNLMPEIQVVRSPVKLAMQLVSLIAGVVLVLAAAGIYAS